MSNFVIGIIRTVTPIIVGGVASWLITLGVNVDGETQAAAIIVLTSVSQSVYYVAVRALAEWKPWLGILLGVNKAPDYAQAA